MTLSLKHDACDESHDHERGDGPEKEIESAEQREEEADVGLAHVLRLSAAFRNHCVTAGAKNTGEVSRRRGYRRFRTHGTSIRLDVTQRKAQRTRFPGHFVSGQDAVSQAQLVDHARTLGWSIRTGENASLIAARDGREVLLPAPAVKYSTQESARLVAELNPSPYVPPGRGRPGSGELAQVIHFYRVTGLPTVGVGRRWGPFVPQIRDPVHDAPTLRSIDEDMQAVAEQRWDWAQPWHPGAVTAENRDEVARRRDLWRPETRRGGQATKWRPCSHEAICMWASSSRHLHGNPIGFIGEKVIEAKDPRTVRRAISIGSSVWASLGAWPWATREAGALGDDWADEDDIWTALWDHVDRLARRARRLADLIETSAPTGC